MKRASDEPLAVARRTHWRLAALGMLAFGCGPSTEDIGIAALVSMPLAFLATCLPPWLLRRLREGPRSRLRGDARPALIGFGVTLLFALVGLVRGLTAESWDDDLVWMTALVTSAAGMFYGQLTWLIFDRTYARFGRFALPTLLAVQGIPGLVFAFHRSLGLGLSHDSGQAYALFAWVFPGYFGVPALLLFAISAAIFVSMRRKTERLRG